MADDLGWFASQLCQHLEPYLELSSERIRALYEHYDLLKRWNAKINLTSIRSPDEIVTRHYCESLFFGAQLTDAPPGTRIADIGSGAGFPGIPMAVWRRDWSVTLVESHQKKAVFLRESTRGLPNVTVIAERAEQASGAFDWLVARAVSPEDVLALAPRLGTRVGLLMGLSDFDRIAGQGGWMWSEATKIPWADQQVCVFGRVVSRGTS